MLAEELNIFKDTKKMCVKIMKYYENMPKIHRGCIGMKMYLTSLELLDLIIIANREREKRKKVLEDFLEKIGGLKADISLCDECRLLSLKEVANIVPLIENITKQATAWKNTVSTY